jgi:hypothetical protein
MEGKILTREAILENIKGVQFHSYKRTGMTVLKGNNQVSLQVRESRYYPDHESKGKIGHGWHDISESHFLRDKRLVDFYVFLTYLPTRNGIENQFVVVPSKDLEQLIKTKDTGQNDIYRFYFHFEGEKVFEIRHGVIDYSQYLNSWDLISEALNKKLFGGVEG